MQKQITNLLAYGAAAYVAAKLLVPIALLALHGVSYTPAIFGVLSAYSPGI